MNDVPVLVKVAGASPEALRVQAARLAAFLQAAETVDPTAVAWTACVGRADLPERAAVAARSEQELLDGLRAVAEGTAAPGVVSGRKRPGAAPRVAFIAPGHGVAAAGLLAEVYGHVPAVTETLDSLTGVLGEEPLSVLVNPDTADAYARTEVAQPTLYALAVSLGAWWRSAGVEPDLVVGHSVGGYAAAALAGVFSIEDGARLVTERGRLMGALPPSGAMAAVLAPPQDLEARLADELGSGEVTIAVYNGPRNTVISGPAGTVDAIVTRLAGDGIRSVRLPVSYAFHSSHIEPALGPLGEAFARVDAHAPRSGLVSDASGEVAGAEVTTAGYWLRHTREPVRFSTAVRTILGRGVTTLVELGPGALLPVAATTAAELDVQVRSIPTLAGRAGMLTALGDLWTKGVDVDWTKVNPRPRRPARLPTYAFQRTTHLRRNHESAPAPVTTPPAPAPATPSAAPRTEELAGRLRRELTAIMGLDGTESLDPGTGLFDLGLTSAMVVELRRRLEHALGREVPATAVFDHPTIGRLAAYLATDGREAVAAPRRRDATAEPLAIIGMACRFPGGANDPAAFWELLSEGRDATGEVPRERWDAGAFYDPDPSAPGKAATARGGFLDVPVDAFDADAFGISPREARSMDPQQRLLLEVAYEALDDAGCTTETLEESTTSVYVGINTSDYMQLLAADGSADIDAYLATGNTFSVAAGRLAYLIGARGPAMAVDTACSSSLVAAHLAAQSLRSGESDVAVVGGVNLMMSPVTTVSLAKMRALSPDGRCRAFDAAADGYGRGEGCGVVILKRLSDAQAAGDRIWAVLRGIAVNQDGRSAGLTVPNGRAQQRVIREALLDAGAEPDSIGYVEAHGTGTPLGDPLELSALTDALRPGGTHGTDGTHGTERAPLLVGSVKTNVGHLEAAAGVCGLIKVALALHHRSVPAHLHFQNPSPHVRWDGLPVVVPTERTEWTSNGGPRLAGLSSFGFSGTNAHAVLEEAPVRKDAPPPGPASEPEHEPRLYVVSAQTRDGLEATVAAHAVFLRDNDRFAWNDIARTAGSHRRHFPERLAVVAASSAQAVRRLEAGAVRKGRVPGERPRLVFVYGGEGTEWTAMGRGLLADDTARDVLERCDGITRDLAGWSLLDELTANPSRQAGTAVSQVANLAVQAALTALWRRWGVTPDAVIGHGADEVAAAYASGECTLEDALRQAMGRSEPSNSPARFHDALLAASGERTTVVEIGSDAALTTAVTRSLPEATVLPSPRTGTSLREAMLDAAGALYVLGHPLDHDALAEPGERVPLPPRQWVRSRHWLPARPVGDTAVVNRELDEALARDVYEIEWLPRTLSAGPPVAHGTWVLLADRRGIADRVAARLAEAGHDCRLVPAEADPDVTRARLEAALDGARSVRGVVHLGSLDAREADGPGSDLDHALAISCGPLLAAPKALEAAASDQTGAAPRLWLVTQGGVAAGKAPAALSQSPAWGLGRVVALEHPGVWGGMVDLDPAERDADADVHAALIVAELLGPDGEDQIAYRSADRLVARLVRAEPLPPVPAAPLDGEGAYLITGGRGALGLRVAARLAERGARHLVLLGRRPPAPGDSAVREAIRRLAEAGATVHTPGADVADPAAMAEVFDTARTPWPGIRGVVHAAGVFEPAQVDGMSWDAFRDVLRSKVEGTLVLDALTTTRELDFFVMFSSASSVWGSALAGHYVAANHFQDVMAHDRVRRGLPGVAVNWGWWSDSDMAARHAEYFESMGLHVLPDDEGLAAFDRLVRSSRVQVTVAPVDWSRFRPVLEAKRARPLLASIRDATAEAAANEEAAGDGDLLERLGRAAPPEARLKLVEELVRREVRAVLGRAGDAPLPRDLGFFDAGMDSISSVELRTRLESALGTRLPATVAFEHASVAALAAYLAGEVLGPSPGPGPGDELADLPEDELLRLLEEELEDRYEHG